MNYYIADLHFGHANAIAFDNRPFETVEEMNEALILNWNARVTPEDTVYVLGDMFMKHTDRCAAILAQLNGHKHLISGNHDRLTPRIAIHWESVQPYLEVNDGSTHIIMCHYPTPFYHGAHHGTVMLYGHVHSSVEWELLEKWEQECWERKIPCNMVNVGCMMSYMNYTPRTLAEILAANPIYSKAKRGKQL